MNRVRWCQLPILCPLLLLVWISTDVVAVCWYEGTRYEEETEVATLEPCLNCTCTRGTLLCYLRVCPRLPNPPPHGCILLHRFRTCCPELICADYPIHENAIEARAEPGDGVELLEFNRLHMRNACVANGTIYGPGSAMDSSSLCEYCYCLAGKQQCVKPKCLLPLEGCTPIYETHSCCPVKYNCTKTAWHTTSTTTALPSVEMDSRGGCIVSGQFYPEGGKVLGVGHSVCDNCYCLRGILRCEPLSCAPPLLGCAPVIKPGECCAASYNCSGNIAIEPEPNYGEYPTVSKDYAKLRKEFHQKRPTSKWNKREHATENSNSAFYVIAETSNATTKTLRSPGHSGTTRHFTGTTFNPSTKHPYYYNSKSQERNSQAAAIKQNKTFPGVYYATTNYEFHHTNYRRPISTTYKPNYATHHTINAITVDKNEKTNDDDNHVKRKETTTPFDVLSLLLEGRENRGVDNKTELNEINPSLAENEYADTTTESETSSTTQFTTESIKDSLEDTATESTLKSEDSTSTLEESYSTTTEQYTIITAERKEDSPVTFKTVINTTDCVGNVAIDIQNNLNDILQNRQDTNVVAATTILPVDINEINKLQEVTGVEYSSTETDEGVTSTEHDITEVDLEFRVNVATPPGPLTKIQTLVNLTKNKEDGSDYDYNDLPPSLPNLRIIPFVAADALDSKKEIIHDNAVYPVPEKGTESSMFNYANLFSPPTETEGGFVPKNPPIMSNFYDNTYLTTSADINAVTPSPLSSLANDAILNEESCVSNGKEIRHRNQVDSNAPCITCVCLYGTVVCHRTTCPLPPPGCRMTSIEEHACCPQYICENDQIPTLILDRLDITSNPEEAVTVAEGIVTPDPFKDVIRTEPAPDLQSLMGDMLPYFTRKTTHTPETTTQRASNTKSEANDDESMNYSSLLDRILQIFPVETIQENSTKPAKTASEIQTQIFVNKTPADRATTAPSVKHMPHYNVSAADNTDNDAYNRIEDRESSNIADAPPGVGILKLAGCNIYGRMYRVGKIISELSGPCMECKCTEIGVQCKDMNC